MYESSNMHMGLPSIDDYLILKEAFEELSIAENSTIKQCKNSNSIYIRNERTYIDADFIVWPPLTICIQGIIKATEHGSRLQVKYTEQMHNDTTRYSSLQHLYRIESSYNELVEYSQEIKAFPQMSMPVITSPEIYLYDAHIDQADLGTKLLRYSLGSNLELTTGDCGVLYDRIVNQMFL